MYPSIYKESTERKHTYILLFMNKSALHSALNILIQTVPKISDPHAESQYLQKVMSHITMAKENWILNKNRLLFEIRILNFFYKIS